MRNVLVCIVVLFHVVVASAQKTEKGFDFFFKPTDAAPRYYVVTEKKDSLWHREAYYIPERGMAMEGWYKDKECKIPHGTVTWYHPNRFLKSKENYWNGQKDGVWLEYGEEGKMRDSTNYKMGRQSGIGLRWFRDGMLADSTKFDGNGNGVQVSWFEDGNIASAGYWISDSLKNGRWKYYHPNGKLKATEDYVDGKKSTCSCFDEAEKVVSADACEEREAEFTGGGRAWIEFIQRNLRADVPARKNAPYGQYTVVAQFIVSKDGHLEGIKTLTHFGFGMEEEVERMLKKSPGWLPAQQFGRKVNAYRMQPITFVVSKG